MGIRRPRLVVESLEDRTNPASVSELQSHLIASYLTTETLVDTIGHPGDFTWMANPAAKPILQSLFTGIYKQSQATLLLAKEFPGSAEAGLARPFAQLNASVAMTLGSVLGFNVRTGTSTPGTPTTPTTPADSGMTDTMPSATDPSFIDQGNGLKIWDVVQGTGAAVTAGASVNVFYTGWLAADGTKFDSNRSPNPPVNFSLANVIQGWQQGLVGMQDGGIRRLYVPAALAYGASGSGSVPANADLIFEIKLISHTNAAVGSADPAHSLVSVAPASLTTGGTSTVTLTAKDANGNALTTGGSTVTFGLGAGTGVGSFGAVTDNGNGTYTATFTSLSAGTNTITATLDGQTVTSTAPTITIVGPADPGQSVVSLAPSSIATGGVSTVTLTAKDASGTPLTTGGSTVLFSVGVGTAQGSFGTVTDNGNGTYTAVFTGGVIGTNTITATLDGVALTSTAPTITVVGAADPSESTVSAAPSSLSVAGSSTVTLTSKDIDGNQLPIGGSTVTFALGAGTGQGTFGLVTDNGDGTYSALFTGTVAGSNTITATLNGQAVTSAPPTITVVGAADPSQSTVAVSPASVQSGDATTITLTAKDANGNAETIGGSTVTFSLGAGIGQGTIGIVMDNGDGTYSATFTGTTVGANTITATLGGASVTTTPPTVTVVEPADPAQSTVAVAPASIESGSPSTVTLATKDASGTAVGVGGSTVTFGLGAGVGQGTFSTVVDNGDGTYSATFTGTIAGTNTITATLGGQPVTSLAPTITVTSGTADPAHSTVAAAPASIQSGSNSTVTLTAKDAGGNVLTTGGSTVLFSLGIGVGQGTFGTVTDNGDGTYSAMFTGTTAGTNTITATIGGQALTTAPASITVTPGAADLAQSIVSLAPASIANGGISRATLTAKDANGNLLGTGGSTVLFELGTDSAEGDFGTVMDNGDGTYTAVFTATGAGTNTITGNLDGQDLTSTAPTITVTEVADPAQSFVAADSNSIQSGDTTNVTLTANDSTGTQLSAGGSIVVFSLGNGVGQGTFGTVTDNGDGTYTAVFTGTTAGTNTISATIDGHALTSTPTDMEITPGTADPAQSTVAIAPPSIANGGTSTITLAARDASGNLVGMGGSIVAFSLGLGTAQGTIDTVSDNDDGTYTATFTATGAGTNSIMTTLDGATVTSTLPTLTVT